MLLLKHDLKKLAYYYFLFISNFTSEEYNKLKILQLII